MKRLLTGLALCSGFLLPGWVAGDSLNLRLAGVWPFNGLQVAIGVAARNLSFVGSGGGVLALDIADPASPRLLSERIQTYGVVCDLFYDSSTQRLYVAAQQEGLSIWDLSVPSNPIRLGLCPSPANAWRVAVSGNYAYVADRDSGLRIISVADPTQPYQVGRHDPHEDAQDVAVADSYAYFAGGGALRVINVADPANPYQVGYCDSLRAIALALSGSFAYVVNGYAGLRVVSIADPVHPIRLGTCPTPYHAVDVALAGSCAYVSDDGFGLLVIDVTDPANPNRVAAHGGLGYSGVTVSDTLGFVFDYWVHIMNVRDPPNLFEVGTYCPPHLKGCCAVAWPYVYVCSNSGLHVVDASNPLSTRTAGFLPIGIGSMSWADIAFQGSYVYIARDDFFEVVDVSEPSNPRMVGECGIDDLPMDVAVSGDLGCIGGQSRVSVLNISDPTHPVLVGTWCDSLGTPWGVALCDSWCYVADGWQGLRVVSLADPANPSEVGHWSSRQVSGVAAGGSHAFVAHGDSGLAVINVADPANPYEEAYLITAGQAYHAATADGYVYLTGGDLCGLRMIDVTDPTRPREVGYYDGIVAWQNAAPAQRYICVVDFVSGLRIFENQVYGLSESGHKPVRSAALQLLENPISGNSIVLSVNIAEETNLCFRLYQVAGGQVMEFPAMRFSSGRHIVRLLAPGLAAGVYLLKPSSPLSRCGVKVIVSK